MLYLVLKGFHVAAVGLWLTGMLLASVSLAALRPGGVAPSPAETRFLVGVRSVNRFAATPAMLISWALGVGLAVAGHWFGVHWLSAKVLVVLALSALHGVQTGALRHLARDPMWKVPALLRLGALAIVSAALAIVFLVLVKPF